MNKFNLLLLAITAILFASCSHESEVNPQGTMNYPVSFSLSGDVATRATQTGNPSNMAALDREKKVTTLHAVVYKGGVFYKVFTPSLSGSNYTFDMNQEGTFDVYLVANAATALSDQFATNAATPAMLGNLLATQTPGDGNTADNFLMTAQKFTATTKQGTPYNGGEVKLARAAARVDVYNRVEKLAMTKLTFKNRAVQTRLTSPFTMEGIALTQDKTYESAQGLKAYELIGAMYGYENVTTGATELVLEGTYNGVAIAPKTIKLEGIPFKRNHLYSIILSEDPNAPGGGGDVPPGGDISNKLKVQIVVNDWNEAQIFEWKGQNLIGGAPDFTVSGAPFATTLVNPTLAETKTNNATTLTFTLTNIGAEPVLRAAETLPAGVTIAKQGVSTVNADGKLQQIYTVNMPTIASGVMMEIPLIIENPLDPRRRRVVRVQNEEYNIMFTTAKESGSTVKFTLNADYQDQADCWIDLNNNGVRDENEGIPRFGPIFYNGYVSEYNIASKTIKIYGKITEFSCWDNQITSLELSKCRYLEQLNCGNNPITSIDVSLLTSLKNLACNQCQLATLDISKNTAMSGLFCDNNQLSVLDVSKNTALSVFYCDNNRLTSLDISNNKDLYAFGCSNNLLTTLDVSKHNLLSFFRCNGNQLTTLKLQNHPDLTNMWCNNNQLTTLDVTGCGKMNQLDCSGNQLSILDLSKNENLVWLSIHNNQFTAIDITNNPRIQYLFCFKNKITGANMTKIVNSLPLQNFYTPGEFVVYDTSGGDGNIATVSDVNIAKGKNYKVLSAPKVGNNYTTPYNGQ